MGKLTLRDLILINIALACSVQIIPSIALLGAELPFYFLLAMVGFLFPCLFAVSELTTAWPDTGGGYVWVGNAFGDFAGFFTVFIQWLSNLIWYPTMFAFIMTIMAYVVDPGLSTNKTYILFGSVVLFWTATVMNLFGIKMSSLISSVCTVVGVIFPVVLLGALGASWLVSGHASEVSWTLHELIPQFDRGNIAYFIEIVVALVGFDMAGVHAGDVVAPERNYPYSFLISGIVVVVLTLMGAISISTVIGTENINLLSAVLEAITAFFDKFGLISWVKPVVFLVLLGNIGSVVAWMISSTRGMQVGAQSCSFPKLLYKTNRFDAPVSILIIEAIIFTVLLFFFYLMPTIEQGFWLLLVLASQIAMIYYMLIFASVIRLRYRYKHHHRPFKIPGGNFVVWCVMLLGLITVFVSVLLGFFAPEGLAFSQPHYVMKLLTGLVVTFCLPCGLYYCLRGK